MHLGQYFCVIIVTTNQAGVTRFTFIFLINGLCFGFIRMWIIILVLLILNLPFPFILVFSGRCGLNRINLNSLTGGRSRTRSILYIRIIRFGIGVTGVSGLRFSMKGADHTINNMIRCWRFWGRVCRRTRSIRDQIIKCSCLRINEIYILSTTNCLLFSDNTAHG
jgi:hypothetical protein